MDSLIDIQDDIKSKIEKSFSNFKKSPKERLTVSYFETRFENLEKLWQLFQETHIKIISSTKKSELIVSKYNKDGIYDEVEELYINFKSTLKELIKQNNLKDINSEVSSKNCHNFKLPEIKIPSFSGKYHEWFTFRDLFLGLIHKNTSLDDAQKLYYLKGYLTGDAELLLRNVNVTADNYSSSWEKIESIYNNKRFLANGIVKRLMKQKSLTVESAIELKKLLNTTSDCLEAIKNLKLDLGSFLIIHIVTEKLDITTRKDWELKIASELKDDIPTLDQLKDFLESRYRGLENVDTKVDRVQKTTQVLHVMKDKKVFCAFCSGEHKINSCQKFIKESIENRRNFVQQNNLCFNCLLNNHTARYCKNTLKCQVCKRRHHSLLHPAGVVGSEFGEGNRAARSESSSVKFEDFKAANQAEVSDMPLVSCLATGSSKNTVLLTTALVMAESKTGSYHVVRTLLDQGSQGSFITESMVQYLGLNKNPSRSTVLGVSGDKGITSKSMVLIKLRSRVNPTYQIQVNAHVLKSVTSLLPSSKVTRIEWTDLSDYELADPDYFKPNKIDILLGAEVYSQVIQQGVKKNVSGTLLAQETTLGWILSGISEVDQGINSHSKIIVMHTNVQDDELLRKFWELEEPSRTKRMLTEEETKCEELFTTSTYRNEEGRYVVRLPLKDSHLLGDYGESKGIAEKRLKALEARLSKKNKLKDEYTKVLQEYLTLNHMEEVSQQEKHNKMSIYLPHHAVVREDRETTKVRVVFDASCKRSNGRSLNDDLMIGPSLQDELRHIIMRLRTHRICIVADIIKMYRQVLVNRQDTPLQRILWRDSPEKEIKEFELLTVTFGTASAPYLAVRTLQQLAIDECGERQDPNIKKIIVDDFYMDDLMSGAENTEEAFQIYTELTKVLAKGGFQLQKWKSNSHQLLERIKGENDEAFQIKVDEVTKILGLNWCPLDDCFKFSLKLKAIDEPVTKRKIISDIARLYDPLGWLAPSIIVAKILIQKLWLTGLQWDEEVSSDLVKEWLTYRQSLVSLVDIKIPRWLHTTNKTKRELYGYADASKVAYAAVVYLRIIDEMGNVQISLISSKTKVAPIKQVSIPRLELCGAVLLTKLMLEIAEVMKISKENLYAFTDSEVVLAWLNSHPSRWKTFVANRVSDILSNLDTHHWSHIASKQNPADCASRGISPSELTDLSLWWQGPDLLKEPKVVHKRPKHIATQLEEIKVHASILDVTIWNRFSSLSKLIRVIAYCRRFLNLRKNVLKYAGAKSKQLTAEELDNALEICIKRCQEEHLNQSEKNKSFFNSLNIFVDPKGITRVGGRLEMSQLNYDKVHPILIPRESFLTKLLITDAHLKTMHGGPQLMITYLRSKYWIIGIKTLVKGYVRNCVKCLRYTAKTRNQLMGQLPSSRVTPSKPFLRSGVDYAGPINIRMSKGRGNKSYKGYIAVFVCMVTRAIHLEAVSALSTTGFLTAFKRFVARRGRCTELHSDNGTNFVGAARELLYLFNEEKSSCNPELAEELGNNGTTWHFIPPQSPNFGGIWEAGVKSTKYHLKRVIGNSTLTFEEISTVLAQIEACLNSRPLSYIEDQDKMTILTPGHFLVGEPLVLPPDLNYEKSNISTLKRWQLQQRMMQDFWRRWSHDYLHQFLQRHKWQHKIPEPNIGDVVLVKEDNLPPGRWLLGKIKIKHPGPDGLTRIVTLQTQNSIIKRPINKLCILPINI